MSLLTYLKDNLLFLALEGAAAVFTVVFLSALGVRPYGIFFLMLVLVLANVVILAYGYVKKNAYYKTITTIYEELDQKYLVSELIEPSDFADSRIFYEMLRGANKDMNDRIAFYRGLSNDYREYIESWVHEIKTPIASARLALENNPGPLSDSVTDDLSRVEALVMNVLYYARSSNVEKDYIVKRVDLKQLVTDALKRNAKRLIENRMQVKTEGLEVAVYTDEKWLAFMLDQLITNAIKYRAGKEGSLAFCAQPAGSGVALEIRDSGIGIPREDVSRVFDKGFTGENGRRFAGSTGMGLYLVKKLADKLGLAVSAASENGAAITITFPKSDMYIMENLSKV